MKILALLTDAYGGHGGIAKYNRDLLEAFISFPETSSVKVLPRVLRFAPGSIPMGIDFRALAARGKFSYLKEVLLSLNERYDLIVCGHINLLLLAFVFARLNRCRIVITVFGIDVWKPHRSFLVNLLLKHVDLIISISDFTRRKLMGWSGVPKSRIGILPNAIDVSSYGVAPKRADLVEKYDLCHKRVLLTLARLSADESYKGIDEVLEVLPSLLSRDGAIVYVIAGDGTDRLRLERKANLLGVKKNVRFVGFVDEKDKADYFRLADVFVMPGFGEGFGFVFLEALACGVPVIASRVDGSYEAVREGRIGEAVNPQNTDELLATIMRSLTRTDREIPQGLEYFSIEKFRQRLRRLVLPIQQEGSLESIDI